MTTPKPVVLCILDGWGLRADRENNAPALAATPTFDRLMATCPNATLLTHGPDVGLPTGQMGNSEVGHTNIGAGRVVAMDLGQIDLAIEDGSFATNDALQTLIGTLRETGGAAHVMGLASPGGVHAHQAHIAEAARVIATAGVPVRVHAITDGRDVPPKSATGQLTALEAALPEGAEIVNVIGRYYAMDRDNRWERVEAAWQAMRGSAAKGGVHSDAAAALAAAYGRGETDEFVLPSKVAGFEGIAPGDGVLFMNFRADRAREILSALADPGFDAFDVSGRVLPAACVGLVEYSEAHNAFMQTMFPKRAIANTLSEWVAKHGRTQFHTAETEKYPHVTFFLSGGKEEAETGEDRFMAPSPKVATYDLQPEMSAAQVTEALVGAIEARYDLIVVNYANPDMVGHTGDLQAAMAACAAVDAGLGAAVEALGKVGGVMIVTADHGNCETMVDPETGGPHTAHTLNPVPVILVGGQEGARLRDGRLADLAPTVIALMGLPKPMEMTGESLVK